jgi:UDP:flavonoid glycosyltransferase YjiC (YdhE family)
VRVLFSTTANDGHVGPLLPFARACVAEGHEVRIAAPASYAAAVARAGLRHEPFADVPPDLIGPIMARLPTLPIEDANDVVLREVFGRLDAQAALPAVSETVERWRPHLVVRESAELASLAAAVRAGVPHVHVSIGMHEIVDRFATTLGEPLEELGRLAGLPDGVATAALAAEPVLSLVPEVLDHPGGAPAGATVVQRFHEHAATVDEELPAGWGDPDLPLVYVTFGTVSGSIPAFAGVFREALDAFASLDVRVLLTVGRKLDPAGLGPVPSNAHVVPWLPQDAVLARAAAMVGHGGFGTTMGALAAGVPQVVVPLFAFDQVVNGEHVAAVGAGLTTGAEPGGAERAAEQLPGLLASPAYAVAARVVAQALRDLPPPSAAVPYLTRLAAGEA